MEIIKLNLIPSGVNPTCHAKQYDKGRTIRFELFNGLTPYTLQSGDTVTLNLRKPDNTIIESSVTATQGNKYVDLVTTEQMCAVAGYNLGTFKIVNGETDIGTLNFIMEVGKDVLANGIPSQSVIEDLDALVAEAVGDDYYTKNEVDDKLALKADTSDVSSISKIASATADNLSLIVKSYNKISPYLYKRNVFFNNGVETAANGYDTYFIPLGVCDFVAFDWDSSPLFYGSIAQSYVFNRLLNDNSITPCAFSAGSDDFGFFGSGFYNGFIIGSATTKGVYFSVKNGNEAYVRISVNNKYTLLDTKPLKNALYINDKTEFANSSLYLATANTFNKLASGWLALWLRCKAGDVFEFIGAPQVLTWRGTIRLLDGTSETIPLTSTNYTITEDCAVCVFYQPSVDNKIKYIPVDALTIDASNIIGNINTDNQFVGLSAVAFGTSLTYRAQTTYGYLQYLPALSGMTIENQGIGSSTILGNMLTAIKNYSSYSDKNVCILEGFVNDWYQNKALGVYTDETETTVCGCVRSALNYMLSQNANLTIFLVLDHYGKLNSGVDCSSTAENASNLTQYEYYEEISKVANSLGIPVIKLYEISGISENTPQYITDNIHPTALGAQQTANAIWYQMRNYPVNVRT